MKDMKNKIRKRRQELGLSLDKLANCSCISRSYLFKLEKEDCNPSIKLLMELARSLKTTVAYLIGEIEVIDEHSTSD